MKNTPDKENSELRYIYLYRTNGIDVSNKKNNNSALANHKDQKYYCTDYFNEMHVLEGKLEEDTLSSIWGIWPGSDNGIECAVAQSYTLYANEETSEDKETLSPFDCTDRKYLSVIQIHITPEIFSRLKMGHEDGNLTVLRPLLSELKDILYEFSKKNPETESKLYYMLSSGDFAVVTASNDPEASFRLSTRIRCRQAAMKNNNDKTWSLFKTYTILAIREDCIAKPGGNENCNVVLRGYYSNQYWANYGKYFEKNDEGEWKLPLPLNPGYALYGRYDFTMQLSFQEYFYYLTQRYQGDAQNPGNEFESVRRLLDLIAGKSISYVNTRLLLNGETVAGIAGHIREEIEKDGDNSGCNSEVELEGEDKREELSAIVEKRIEDVQKLCSSVVDELKKFLAYRKNLRHNLHLFERLIMQCRALNDVSDTRIYAIVILKQIEAALYSLRRALEIYTVSECDPRIITEIAGYVQESVRSIDVYADYIRNNNLQTLQMPNYNIETSSSVEKLLIGYSEFVSRIYDSIKDPEKMSPENAVPIVIPALESEVVSVEVMFADGIGRNWVDEKIIKERSRESFVNDLKLVIVKSPTQTELSYMSSMIFSLLHEIAHQLRYESREERNKTLTAICMERLACKLTEVIGELFCFETGYRDIGMPVRNMLEHCIKEVFLSELWEDERMGEFSLSLYKDAPLVFFKKAVSECCTEILQQKIPGVIKDILEYVRSTARYFACTDNVEYKNVVRELKKKVQDLKEFSGKNRVQEIIDTFKIYFEMVMKCEKTGGTDEFAKDNPAPAGRVILNRLYELVSDKHQGRVSVIEYIEDGLYKKLCEDWQTVYKDDTRPWERDGLYEWNAFGRWMGIDVRSPLNKKEFSAIFQKCILERSKELCREFEHAIGRYREETADIFMCKTGGLFFSEYVSLMLINVKCDPGVEDNIIDRILHVTVSMWCPEDPERIPEKFREVIGEAVEKIYEKTKAMFKYAEENSGIDCFGEEFAVYREELDEVYKRLQTGWEKWSGIMCDNAEIENMDALSKLYQNMLAHIQKIGCESRLCGKFEKKIRHFIKYITVMAQLLGRGQSISAIVSSQKEYFEDLRRGAKKYEPTDYLRSDSYIRKFPFGELLPIYSKDELGTEERRKYNKFCIETLLDLFYSQKFRYAKKAEKQYKEGAIE